MPGLIRGIARTAAIAGTATAVSNNVSRRQAGRWAQQQEPQQEQYAPPPQTEYAAPPADSESDETDRRLAQLKDLADLRTQGILTDAEFDAQKQRILAS
jgi:hypothetical protein